MARLFSLLLAACSFIFFNTITAQDSTICYLRDPGGRIREHNADFLKMQLDIKLNATAGLVTGNVKYEFKPIQYQVDTLFLNAPAINIKKVMLNGKEAKYTTNSEGLVIKFLMPLNWNNTYKLEISYEATPRKGLYFVGWDVDAPGKMEASTFNTPKNNLYFTRQQIWTQGQGTDNRYWIPCYDDVNDKMVTETTITFDSAYTVISNGVLKEKKKNANGTTTWHYAMSKPMVPYLVMIGIDKYAHKDYKSKNGMVSRQYYYANHPEVAAPTYAYSAEMMDWLSSELQVKYPWETYCNVPVQDFMYGAMENTTATVYGDFLQSDVRGLMERQYAPVNAHELTHQWFGDCITEYSATHHWLHESFATYYSKQFMRQVLGEAAYEAVKRTEANNAINVDRADRFAVASSRGGSARHYPKGSFVIDMLRYVVGDSVYRKTITAYLKKHAYGNVQTNDFMMAFMETAGVNLDWFFDEWVNRAGVPNYEVNFQRLDGQVKFTVRQTQATDELTGYFKMPIMFEVHYKDGTYTTQKEWIDGPADTVYMNVPPDKEISFALFDAGSHVLKTVNFLKSYEDLLAQAEKAPHYIDRYDALLALKPYEINKKRDFLIAQFNRGEYNAYQTEIVSQLIGDRDPKTLELLKKALRDKDFLVRRSVVELIDNIPAEILPDVETALQDSAYITIEIALRKLCRQFPANSEKYLAAVEHTYGVNNNVRIAWLELKIKPLQATGAAQHLLDELVNYTSNRFEFRTRIKAMEAVERLNYSNEALIKNLFNASLYNNSRLANPAQKTLRLLLSSFTAQQTARNVLDAGKWKDWERAALENLLKM